MPGQASLKATEYYAHPRNAFWPIMLGICRGIKPTWQLSEQTSYKQRCSEITNCGFALWDVLAQCERPGSLDGAIVRSSERANDIQALIQTYPQLHTIAFNGRTAEALFKRHVSLDQFAKKPETVCLPSSSPAMARLTLEEKFKQWCEILDAA
ncbi:MAG: DNA-deoxyinosine glycosylase [Granulosicoccus sp.]|nr:DNA-deoxyinosine glycosylase [Granulosicoccus sp.]